MPTIKARIKVRDSWNRKIHWFFGEVELAEFPKVGEKIWLNFNNRFCLFKATKRFEMEQGQSFVEYEFRLPLFSIYRGGTMPTLLLQKIFEDEKWILMDKEKSALMGNCVPIEKSIALVRAREYVTS